MNLESNASQEYEHI